MNPDHIADLWSFFDRIYCISLKERPDRRAQAAAQFARVGLADRVMYMMRRSAIPRIASRAFTSPTWPASARGLADGARRLLIFEDDVIFKRFRPGATRPPPLIFWIGSPDWQILFLGCLVRKSRGTETPAVRKVAYRCLAHAYALHRSCAEQLVQKPWRGIPFDVMLSRFDHGLYACYPSFAFQSDTASDNLRLRHLDLSDAGAAGCGASRSSTSGTTATAQRW